MKKAKLRPTRALRLTEFILSVTEGFVQTAFGDFAKPETLHEMFARIRR